MSSNIAIKVKNLTKSYHIYEKPKDRLLQMLWRGKKQYFKEFSAIKDISFTVERGDSVGILGHNGAGKSTLLQLLTGTLSPTSGVIEVNGRVAALLELGAGFNPEFSGKENVYMNATILGLSEKEIDDKYDDILTFASIGDFIDRPVKTYSSGMYVRLAFAVAVHTDPDVLIIDEALAVGDIRFQMKCLRYMEELKINGTTIFFVSHAPEQVKRFCNKAIWLDKGGVKAIGTSSAVCDQYREFMSVGENGKVETPERPSIDSRVPVRILSTELDKETLEPNESISLTVEYEILDDTINGLLIGIAIYTASREYIFGPNTYLEGFDIPNTKGKHKICYKIPSLPLLPGTFSFDVGIFTDMGLITLDYLAMDKEFQVVSDYVSEGLVYIKHEWEIIS